MAHPKGLAYKAVTDTLLNSDSEEDFGSENNNELSDSEGELLYLRVGLATNAVQSSRHNQFAERKQWMVEWMGVHTVRLHVNEQSKSFIGDRPVRQVLPLQLTICESASQSPSKGLNAKSSLQTFMLHIIKQSSV